MGLESIRGKTIIGLLENGLELDIWTSLKIFNNKFKKYKNAKLFYNTKYRDENSELHYNGFLRFIDKIINMKDYKFIIVCENNYSSYDENCMSISEKLFETLETNSLPIYFGCLDIEIVFPNLFKNGVINGRRFKTKELIDKIKNMSNDEYKKRIENIKKYKRDSYLCTSIYSRWIFVIGKILEKKKLKYKFNRGANLLEDINKNLI